MSAKGVVKYDAGNWTQEEIQELKILDYVVLLFLTFILGILILANIAKYCITDTTLRKNIGFYNASYQYDYVNLQTFDYSSPFS